MASEFISKVLFRFILPLTLLTACIVRYNALSAVYLLCLLVIPLLPSPSQRSFSYYGSSMKLQAAILGISLTFILSHIIFQVVLVSYQPYGHFIRICSDDSDLAQEIGFNRFDGCNVSDIIRLLSPDIAVFVIALISVLSSRHITVNAYQQDLTTQATFYRQEESTHLEEVIPLFVVLMLLLGGIMQPNVLSSVYFFTFIVLGISWAFHLGNSMQKSFKLLLFKILLTVYAGLHVLVLYLYQLKFFQDALSPKGLIPRLLGLPAIIDNTDCTISRELSINKSLAWPFYVYPVTIFLLYWILAIDNRLRCRKHHIEILNGNESRAWWHPKSWSKVKEDSPLLDNEGPSQNQYGSVRQPEQPAIRAEEIVEPVLVQGTFSSIMMFLMRQSYIAALIIMMTWSITYHSWLTFVLLLWACLTWITPFARWFCMASSPYLVIYSELLLVVQYIYGMNLNENELPVKEGKFEFSELGLTKTAYPVLHLGAQTLFTWVFLVTLRQHCREKIMKSRKVKADGSEVVLTSLARPIVAAIRRRVNSSKSVKVENNLEEVDHGGTPSDDAKEFMAWLKSMLAKYWILVCCFAFLLVALQNQVSLYQILYMVIFLMGFVIYQFSLRTWKTILRPLWWFMVVYSIVILLLIYTYQFDNMHQYWSNGTHLSDQWLTDIGLRQQSKASLLVELLIPTIFSIILVIQLHFFHKPLMMKINRILRYRKCKRKQDNNKSFNIGDPNTDVSSMLLSTATTSTMTTCVATISDDSELEDDLETNFISKIMKMYKSTTIIFWRLAEIHIPKVVCFVVMLVVVQQVSAINGIFIILLAMAMPSEYVQKFLNYVMIVWSSIVVLVFMVYQMQFVKEKILDTNCTVSLNKSMPVPPKRSHFGNDAWWVGFHKSDAVSRDVRGYLFIVLFIVFEKVVKHHQELYRFQNNLEAPPHGILFVGVTRKMADENVINCLKYLCNCFFSLFGMEINLMVMVIAMSIRGDAVAVVHSLWVVVFLSVHRKTASKIWSIYVGYMSVFLSLQYIMILGWPPGLCKGYPWDSFQSKALIKWLFLTHVEKPQEQYLLLADYFQFLVACCQTNVFFKEAADKKSSHNSSTTLELPDQYTPPDFMGNKTWLDFIKILILDQFLWLTLSIVYITAQSTTSLFNSGFIVGCFFFLWHGQGLYLRPRQTMKRWWKTLIAYNFFVIVAKVWLQLVSCVYISNLYKETDCYLVQLLNLYCIRSKEYGIPPAADKECIAQADSGFLMDAICFIVALIQYRIFKSSYFKFVIREHRKQSEMANRGAQLVEERLQIRLKQSIQRDKKKMQLIRNKVAKLKQRLAQLNPHAQEPLSHYEAIYAGDYYLYEDSETDSDSDIKDNVEDLTLSSLPKQTSEQQETTSKTCIEDGVLLQGDTQVVTADVSAVDSSIQQHLVGEEEDIFKVDATQTTEPAQTTDRTQMTSETQPEGLRRRRQKHHICSDHYLEIVPASTESTSELVTIEDNSQTSASCKEKYKEFLHASSLFLEDVANVAIKFFNETSADYRSIANQLALERKERAKSLVNQVPVVEIDISDTNNKVKLQSTSSSKDDESDTWSMIASEDDHESWKKKDSCSIRIAVSFYYALLANTDLLCYSLMIINHMYYACALSMPLPFFVFLWGMLSIPRPTKRFWIAIITYVELVIVVKYIFQFQFPKAQQLNFNECEYYVAKEAKSPLCPPRIIGIERNQYSSVCDLLLLLALFFHRFALKAHGLWREKAFGDEEDMSPRPAPTQNTLEESPADIQYTQNDCSQESNLQTSRSSSRAVRPNRSVFYNIKRFIQRMLDPEVGTGAVDVYAWMFGSQFIVFVIILSSWSAFSSAEVSTANFAKIIEENFVPKTFLYMLLTQFLFIVFDRYLYMRKHVFAKLLYLVILVFLFHIFLFVIVPELTQRRFTQNVPAIFMYLFQCLYFALSAYQVRCGYPTRILGNFLTKNYTVTSGILFQGIQSIPFLLELRSVLDWVCTKTTLTLSHWLKMEDIYANIFVLKCWRDSEKTWPHPRGMHYLSLSKWLIGGLLVVLLIVVIWFPLLFMSFINSAYISNLPVEATFTLTVGGYQPLFRVTTQQQFIKKLSSAEIDSIVKLSEHTDPSQWDSLKAMQGLQDYKKTGNIVRIKVLSNSSAIWTISPPSRNFLINDLESNSSISLRFKYVFNREPNTSQATLVQESVSGVTSIPLPPGDPIRNDLAKVLRSPSGNGEIKLPNLFPTFIRVPGSGSIKPVSWLGSGSYVNCTIILRRGSTPHMSGTQFEWWEIIQNQPVPLFSHDVGNLELIALNDLVPPIHLSFFASKGIIGLYVGFVWLVGKFVRLFFTSISYRIMFDELPNVNRILKLILEIYMVRESKELKLEEDLFAKLLFLYRSPETLIKWTKYKRL